MIAYMVFCR